MVDLGLWLNVSAVVGSVSNERPENSVLGCASCKALPDPRRIGPSKVSMVSARLEAVLVLSKGLYW